MEFWRKLLVCAVVAVCGVFCCSSVFADEPVGDEFVLLNDRADYDFKVSSDDFTEYARKVVSIGSELSVVTAGEPARRKMLSENAGDDLMRWEQTWLIDNAVLERPVTFTVDKDGVTAQQQDYQADNRIYASQLYAALYKIYFGNLRSRYLGSMSPKVNAEGQYTGFVYKLCCTSNVYELYIQDLLYKGMLQRADLADNEYSQYLYDEVDNLDAQEYANPLVGSGQKRASWNSNAYPFGYLYKSTDGEKGKFWYRDGKERYAFGKGFTYEESDDKLVISPKVGKSPGILNSERLTLIEALQVVEKFMRLSEADMSQLEASIVMYKYGVSGLQYLNEDEYNTVAFMIAKGVLDFENLDTGFYRTVTWGDMIPVLYRVANKDARIEFSSIQLTDGETFWQRRGFSQTDVQLVVPNTEYTFYTEDCSLEVSPSEASVRSAFMAHAAQSGRKQNYNVTKAFDTVNRYKVFGIPLDVGMAADTLKKSIEDAAYNSRSVSVISVKYKDSNKIIVIKFSVVASSKEQAIAKVDDEIDATITNDESYKFTAYTKVSGDGEEIMMISRSSLENAFQGKIDFVADKVLSSTESGAMAYVMPEDGYALVGNEVIVSDDLLITDTNNDVYYNFGVVASLLDSDIRKISNQTVNGESKIDFLNVTKVDLYSSGGSNDTPIARIDIVTASKATDEEVLTFSASGGHGEYNLYNVNQVPKGINTLYRTFTVKSGDYAGKEVTVLVDWVMSVPALNDSPNLQGGLSKAKTWDDYFDVLYTPPEGAAYRAVWDFNINMSNALAGFIFGRKGVEFIKCGWVMPYLTILLPPNENASETITPDTVTASNFLNDLGFGNYIPAGAASIIGSSTENMLDSYFGTSPSYFRSAFIPATTDRDAIVQFYRRSRIQVIQGKKDGKYGIVYGISFVKDNVGTLYRYNDSRVSVTLGADGVLKAQVFVSILPKTKPAMIGSEVDVTTPAGAVYTFLYNGVSKVKDEECFVFVPACESLLKSSNGYLPKCEADTLTKGISVKYVRSAGYSSLKSFLVEKYYRGIFGIDADDSFYVEATSAKNCMSWNEVNTATKVIKCLEENKFYAFNDGNSYLIRKCESGTNNALKSTNNRYSAKEVYGVPVIYVPAKSVEFISGSNGTWQLGKSTLQYFLNRSCIFYSGIVDDVVNSIISARLGYVSVKDVANGTTLLINDTKWVKQGDYWESMPIYNSSIATKAKSDASNAVSELFSSSLIVCSGRSLPLKNYFTEVGIGSTYKDKVRTGKKCLTLDASRQKSVMYVKDGKTKYNKNKTPDCVLFKIKINDSLLLRPVTSSKSTYTICNRATQSMYYNYGQSMLDIGLGSESLNYDDQNSDVVYLEQSGFEQTGDFTGTQYEFYEEYKVSWWEDLKTLILMFVILVCSYMLVISWAAYLGVTKGGMLWLFNAIAGKWRKGRMSGVDVVRLFSFGIYNLDSPPAFKRVAATTVICLMLITAAGKLQGGL